MKKLIFLMLLATSVTFGQQNAPAPRSQAKVLTRAEFDSLFAKPDRILIIDVRRPDEIKDIGGFPVYLNVQIGDLEKSLDWIPKDRTIITVSNHAARGGHAADILTKNGFNVAGTIGVQTYEKDGGTLAKIIEAPPASTTTADKKEP
jgi:rhodanese-related sulfurtransferase